MNKSSLSQIINEYDFKKVVEKSLDDLISQNNIDKSELDEILLFSNEFWQRNWSNLNDLKDKFPYTKNYRSEDLIRAYNCENYLLLLKKYWIDGLSTKELSDCFKLRRSRILKLVIINFDIQHDNASDGYVCKNCFGEEFIVKRRKKKDFVLVCKNEKCQARYNNLNALLSHNEAKEAIKNLRDTVSEFLSKLEDFKNEVIDEPCPMCGEKNVVNCSESRVHVGIQSAIIEEYKIHCINCYRTWSNMEVYQETLAKYKRNLISNESIKNYEKENLKRLLADENKPINVKLDNIISNKEMNRVLDQLSLIDNHEINRYWRSIFRSVKTLNKACLSLLIIILDDIYDEYLNSHNDEGTLWTKNMLFRKKYPEDVPIIELLHEKSGLLNIRKILRKLMKHKIIACSEELGMIFIHTFILRNKDKIIKYTEPQGIKNEVKYLIYKESNYSCSHCGAVDKPLKIAFTSEKKDIRNLNQMISLCSNCFEDITENEILIDGFFALLDVSEYMKKTQDGWNFLCSQFPSITNSQSTYAKHLEIVEEFNDIQVIKAYMITHYNLTVKKKEKIQHMGGFFSYATKILQNSTRIKLPTQVKNNYNVKKYFD